MANPNCLLANGIFAVSDKSTICSNMAGGKPGQEPAEASKRAVFVP
jgi:hypothetical protein